MKKSKKLSFSQSVFDIRYDSDYLISEYIVDRKNKNLYDFLMYESYSSDHIYKNFTLIHGTSASGKTHLSKIWATKHNAVFCECIDDVLLNKSKSHFVVDDIDKINSRDVFHIFNLIKEISGFCLMTTSTYPFNSNLLDLNSRINSIKFFKLESICHENMESFLAKQFRLRSINFTRKAIKYLAYRLSNNLTEVKDMINLIDKKSLENGSKVTIFFLKNIMKD